MEMAAQNQSGPGRACFQGLLQAKALGISAGPQAGRPEPGEQKKRGKAADVGGGNHRLAKVQKIFKGAFTGFGGPAANSR